MPDFADTVLKMRLPSTTPSPLTRFLLRAGCLLLLATPLRVAAFGDEDGRSLAPSTSWQPPTNAAVLQYRVMKIIENEQHRHKAKADELVYAPTCIHAPTIPDFFDLSDIRKETREVAQTLAPLPDLNRQAANIKDVFSVLRATKWGSAVMKKFYPRFGFDIRIDHFTEAMKETEKRRGRIAAAVYDIDMRTIYVNKSEKIGTVAPILLHEIVHSLDNDFKRSVDRERELWKAFDREVNGILREASVRSIKSPDDLLVEDFFPEELARLRNLKDSVEQFRDIRIYRAERVAYDMYYNVLLELSEMFPKFYRIGTGAKKNLRPYDDAELIRTEGLNPTWIDKYQRNLCRIKP